MKSIYNTGIKKWLCLTSIVICFSFGTASFAQVDGKVKVEFPEQERDMETAKATVKAYETGNWEMLKENVTADARFYNLGSYDSLSVAQTIAYWTKGREIATPVIQEDGVWLGVQVPQGPREGEWILHWGRNTLHYPNGDTISFPYHVAMRFSKDKVSQIFFYYDNHRIIRALGYDIQPPLKEDEEGGGMEFLIDQ
jgi:hypothetical protein